MLRCGLRLVVLLCLSVLVAKQSQGADPIKLNGPLAPGSFFDVTVPNWFSPDSANVIYRVDQDTPSVYELYSVPSGGGTPTKLNGPLVANSSVAERTYVYSPDSSRVSYVASQNEQFEFDLFTVPTTGGTPVNLSNVSGMFAGVLTEGIHFSPDSSQVIYLGDPNASFVYNLYSVPASGGTPIKLNDTLVAGGAVDEDRLLITPDSSYVIYHADQDVNDQDEIYSVPLTGGTPVKLNGAITPGGDVNFSLLSSDSSRVVYRADQDSDNVTEIYSVPVTGGVPVKLNTTPAIGGDISSFLISADSSRVVYYGDQDTNDVSELYSVPLAGGTPLKLNGSLGGGDVYNPQISPDSSRVVYYIDDGTLNNLELYSVPIAGGTQVKLNGPLVSGGNVSSIQFSPDSSRVTYRADQETDGTFELYSVPTAGGVPIKLNASLTAGGNVTFFEHNPDSSRVVYYADQETDEANEIYTVPSEGGTPVKINGSLVAGGSVSDFEISPDGRKVLYYADQDTDGVNEIYVRIIREHAQTGGGDWDSASTWNQGVLPDQVMQVYLETSATVTATGAASVRNVNELSIGGGAGTSTLSLTGGAVISALNGISVPAGGIVRGDGRLEGDVKDLAGELRATAGHTLTLASVSAANEGRIVLQGGTLEVNSTLSNGPSGEIVGRGALYTGGLTNAGQVLFSAGLTDVFGVVTMSGGVGEILVSGAGTATFYDDVAHDGDEIRTSGNSTTVFFGDVIGPGPFTGTGLVQMEGGYFPGSSPAAVPFAGDLFFGSGASLEVEIGGLLPGSEHDQLAVADVLSLGGTLDVNLINGFMPEVGDQFDILAANDLQGKFDDLQLPSLTGGLQWVLDYQSDGVSLLVALAGDFDVDGDVDGLDFLLWQQDPTVGLLSDWENNYGTVAGTATAAAVPEPSSMLLFIAVSSYAGRWRRR